MQGDCASADWPRGGRSVTAWLARKLAEQCAQSGCSEPPAEDNCRCPAHRDAHRVRTRDYMRRRRALSTFTLQSTR